MPSTRLNDHPYEGCIRKGDTSLPNSTGFASAAWLYRTAGSIACREAFMELAVTLERLLTAGSRVAAVDAVLHFMEARPTEHEAIRALLVSLAHQLKQIAEREASTLEAARGVVERTVGELAQFDQRLQRAGGH